MKSAAHQYEDKLLEFAYGELPQHEAEAVDAHVRGCNRCSQSLSEIRGVRATMAQLPMEAAPDAGLESLLAYAEQAAKRGNGKPAPSIWKRFLMPLASVMALVTVGIVSFRANEEFDTSPAAAVADEKLEELSKKEPPKSDPAPTPAAEGFAQLEQQGERPAPVVAAATPEVNDAPGYGPPADRKAASQEDKSADLDELDGKRGDVWAPEPKKVAPQSVTRREAANKKNAPRGNAEQVVRDDYSNAAQRGALKDLVKEAPAAPPPPPPVQAQDKLSYGLGSPGGSSSGSGRVNEESAPLGGVGSTAPSKPSPKAPPLQEKQKEEESKKRAKAETEAQAPAPVAAAPSTSSSAPPMKSPSPKGGGYGIKPQMGSSPSSIGAESDDSAALEKTDSLRVDSDAKFAERNRAESRTRSLESARVASSRGDRLSEIRLLAQVLESGARGYERVEALKRICDAYESLGEPERADPFCDQLLNEFPATAAARAVEDRRKRVQRAPAPAAPKSKAADQELKALDDARPAEAAPAAY